MPLPTAEEKLVQLLLLKPNDKRTPTQSFRSWFVEQFNSGGAGCALEDFALYFLNAVRLHSEAHIRANETADGGVSASCVQSPMRQAPTKEATASGLDGLNESLTPRRLQLVAVQSAEAEDNDSPARSQQNRAAAVGQHSNCSTPVRRSGGQKRAGSGNGSFASQCASTPNNSSHDWSQNRSGNGSGASFCLGDFLVQSSSPAGRGQRGKKTTTTPQHTTENAMTGASGQQQQRKKRVVPTTICRRSASESGMSPFGSGGSSFGHENNMARGPEVEDHSQCNILAARKTLKQRAGELIRELQLTNADSVAGDATATLDGSEEPHQFDSSVVTQRDVLERLASIYAALMDLNLITNVLNEVSFLLNLLNATGPQNIATQLEGLQLKAQKHAQADGAVAGLELLANFSDCVYFAARVLERQGATLALLDVRSLSVVLQSDRLGQLAAELSDRLHAVHQAKQRLEAQRATATATVSSDKSCQNVHFQVESDTRQHFTSNPEFSAFKTQRDLFYQALKHWQQKHLSPAWNCAAELRPLISSIFQQSESAVNMAHFAKLFVAQLLISASDTTSPEDIGLAMDQEKLSKLTQRLVAPSSYSTDYQFPRNQPFFRDFIVEARSVAFAEQLKLALYHQLNALSDSAAGCDELSFHSDTQSARRQGQGSNNAEGGGSSTESVVSPEVLVSLLLLAKFLGFVTAQPYNSSGGGGGGSRPSNAIEKKQLLLRGLFQPDFDVGRLIGDAVQAGRLLIAVPWLVQYLVMLDNVTLQLAPYVAATQLLFALYAQLAQPTSSLPPSAAFILRCCLGWLFEEKPIIAEQYYGYRAATAAMALSNSAQQPSDSGGPNAVLEALLPVACPFLAEFRVSIMPAKHALAKNVSRSGRYRYITLSTLTPPLVQPPPAEAHNTLATTDQQRQQRLLEAFLHAQNSNTRRLLDFVGERAYKAVVKDGQHRILLPSKSAADSRINTITSSEHGSVAAAVRDIYTAAAEAAAHQWNAEMPLLLERRIRSALDALLPAETPPIVKRTYQELIRRNGEQRVQQWWHANIAKNDNFYCSNYHELTAKICRANAKERPDGNDASSELQLTTLTSSISDLLDELQHWLHSTSMRPELLCENSAATDAALLAFLCRLGASCADDGNTLPTVYYRLVGGGVIQMLQHLIARLPHLINDALLQAACEIFLAPAMQRANVALLPSSLRTAASGSDEQDDQSPGNGTAAAAPPSIYEALVTVAFVRSLCAHRACFDSLCALLVALIRAHVVTVDGVSGLFVPIFKLDWHPQVLNEISLLLRTVAQETADVRSMTTNGTNNNKSNSGGGDADDAADDYYDDSKSHLFMEVLADFSRDADDF